MASNCRRGFRRFGYLIYMALMGRGRVLIEGNIYIEGKSIEGRDCNMIDPGFGSLQL